MSIAASTVKELRERTGAGMMECKSALVEAKGDIEAALEILRTRGQAKADKKASRVAAEGRIELALAADGRSGVIMEVNCETDFVARDASFLAFASEAAALALARSPADVEALMQLPRAAGGSLEDLRKELVAKIGENIAVRRFERLAATGQLGTYLHGTRIGVLVDVVGGDEELRRDLAMHVAASRPQCVSPEDVPAEALERERRILSEQAAQEGKPPAIVAMMVEGRLRKFFNEITLLGQPFVKDPDISVEKLVQARKASVRRFVRLEVGEGIEKKAANFADEVRAQLEAHA
ncbi:MAG: elongation factor Ts [Gammaproteobacteria bacterium]|nr:MAG: elongation factor Ts [Pseudomonadota bacterium]MBC6945375.1 elongation factor Ts [Gammaproteobacteria bacterium]MCE7895982.1 elongation factor Ts [Gammaproteobacteria bacterium PRO8]MDL1880491.1 elongation factor Ts [Gammaproteobacteria bacterium PRO2]MCL4775881.1 elongation factor Ts [Gammaproteobacteria bacterium]